jgi:hypothetical protein
VWYDEPPLSLVNSNNRTARFLLLYIQFVWGTVPDRPRVAMFSEQHPFGSGIERVLRTTTSGDCCVLRGTACRPFPGRANGIIETIVAT